MQIENNYTDPDGWMKPASKQDGTRYYEYILVYVDDILAVSTNVISIMTQFENTYRLKDNMGEPTSIIGSKSG